MSDFIKRVARAIRHRFGYSDRDKVWRIMRNPPETASDEIVFTSSSDYTGNPKALFLYMIEHGYNEKYKITWLFEREEDFFEFNIHNVKSGLIWNKQGGRKPEALKAAFRAKYVFYSHNVHWIRLFREEQTFINLWHGCGYKADMKADDSSIYYDYLLVTGPKYINIFREVLRKPDGNILDLGYPRNELLFTDKSKAKELARRIKADYEANKLIIWMPTYRKSRLDRLDNDTGLGKTDMPILTEEADLVEIGQYCKGAGVVLLIKQHQLSKDYDFDTIKMSNIKIIDDGFLRKNEADLYELMAATDSLITDYSSVAVDYMLLDKPIGFTLDDFNQYEEKRGWSFDNVKEYMPGHHIETKEELKMYIADIVKNKDPFRDWRRRILPELHTYTDGFSKRILEYFDI